MKSNENISRSDRDARLAQDLASIVSQIHIVPSDVSASFFENKISLTGKVSSWMERRAAEDTAWAKKGITEVDNQLEVESDLYVTD